MTKPILHIYDDSFGDHYSWEVDLDAMTAVLCIEEGTDEWVALRKHRIRNGASGWEYHESSEQHAERVANLERAARGVSAIPIESYPGSTRDLELARRQGVVDALQSARDQGPGWREFGAQVSTEINEGPIEVLEP